MDAIFNPDAMSLWMPLLLAYLMPTLYAFKVRHPQRWSIGFVNICLGWSVLGWFFALFCAMAQPRLKS